MGALRYSANRADLFESVYAFARLWVWVVHKMHDGGDENPSVKKNRFSFHSVLGIWMKAEITSGLSGLNSPPNLVSSDENSLPSECSCIRTRYSRVD